METDKNGDYIPTKKDLIVTLTIIVIVIIASALV